MYFFQKNGFLQNRSNMLYLGIFILSRRCKIKFHGDRPSRKSIWTNLDPKSSFFVFFCNCWFNCCFRFLSHWLEMWFFANAIPSPMSLPYISLLKPTSLTCFQGTKWIQDKRDQGQNGLRTKWIQDKMDPGQDGSRTKWNHDSMDPGQYGSRTIGIQDNRDPGQ